MRADFAQQLGDALNQATVGAQYLAVDVGDLAFPKRYRDNPLGVVVDGGPQLVVGDCHGLHGLGRLLGGGWIMRQQRGCNTALRLR